MRFVLDQDVDARVGKMLRNHGHDCWTASDANLYDVPDDTLTVYAAEKKAVLITHDREFSLRRRRNTVGRHVYLKCPEPDALALLEKHLDAVVEALATADDLFVRVSAETLEVSRAWD